MVTEESNLLPHLARSPLPVVMYNDRRKVGLSRSGAKEGRTAITSLLRASLRKRMLVGDMGESYKEKGEE